MSGEFNKGCSEVALYEGKMGVCPLATISPSPFEVLVADCWVNSTLGEGNDVAVFSFSPLGAEIQQKRLVYLATRYSVDFGPL